METQNKLTQINLWKLLWNITLASLHKGQQWQPTFLRAPVPEVNFPFVYFTDVSENPYINNHTSQLQGEKKVKDDEETTLTHYKS